MPDAPGIALVGLPGTGKSVIGRLLAKRLGRQLCDTDQLIEQAVGRPVPEILRRDGEPRFRDLEREALLRACAVPGSVIATGAGALNDPLNRWALRQHGILAWLQAPVDLLVRRLETDGVPRPLLEGGARGRLATLAAERAPFYRAADVWINAARRPAQVVDELAARVVGAGPRRQTGSHVSYAPRIAVSTASASTMVTAAPAPSPRARLVWSSRIRAINPDATANAASHGGITGTSCIPIRAAASAVTAYRSARPGPVSLRRTGVSAGTAANAPRAQTTAILAPASSRTS